MVIQIENKALAIAKTHGEFCTPVFTGSPEISKIINVLTANAIFTITGHNPTGMATTALMGKNTERKSNNGNSTNIEHDRASNNFIIIDNFHVFTFKMKMGSFQVTGGISTVFDIIYLVIIIANFNA